MPSRGVYAPEGEQFLEERVYAPPEERMDLNQRFLALRDVKKQMIKDIERSNERILEINTQLGLSEGVFSPHVLPDEYPEKREEISKEQLAEFEVELARRDVEAKQGKGGLGGFGGGGGKDKDKEKTQEEDAAGVEDGKDESKVKGKKGSAPAGAKEKGGEDTRVAVLNSVPLSQLEELEKKILHRTLEYERAKLLRRQDEAIDTFDEAVADLRREKFRLEADLKSADMKRLVLYQEYMLLKESEKRDNTLKQRLDSKLAERTDILSKISECQEKLEMKKDEVEKLMEKKKQIMAEFDHLVEDANTFREALLKIFNRKIKRIKKKVKDNDDEEYDSEDEDDEDEDDEDFDDEEEEEVCPPGCDQALYEKVCDLREKRLDQEDVISEFQKSIDAFKKEKDALAKKQKTIEAALKQIDKEITEFQKEKQNKLNAIDVVITLKMHQMEYLVDGKLPDDLTQGLVFSNGALRRLKARIKELIQEKAQLKRKQKELRREHIQLHRDKKTKEQRIAELEARAYDVQMLKFGQLIDLDVLDRMGTNRGAEDLKDALRKQEQQHAAELAEWNHKIEHARMELTELTKENTACLQAVADLTHTQKQLEGVLNNTQGSLFHDPMQQRRKEIQERDQLVQVVNKQAKDIESLKQEIQVLRMKGGQVYG
ncbi:hypothetical protein CYMTET_6449 [Cymbomonas tetramitiformis]|uniref:Flagellar associated protein n=1 Tax=Cymbomonas tetramitiformis TaxID=36881 RepID=A0AAE0GX48_9CHLO|nr:hypothetical protein CYMTET_6449 [Cymbomonas tetramitiformis]